jgi:hypothetical protein
VFRGAIAYRLLPIRASWREPISGKPEIGSVSLESIA